MKRKKRVKGICGLYWIQTERTIQGNISMECEHSDGYYCTTSRTIVNDECLKICNTCNNNKIN